VIIPVQKIVRQQITAGGNYQFSVEGLLTVKSVQGAKLLFINPDASAAVLKVQQMVSQSGVFTQTITPVNDESVLSGGFYVWEFNGPVVRSSQVLHTVTMTNSDASSKWLIAVLTGWVDTAVTVSTYVGDPN